MKKALPQPALLATLFTHGTLFTCYSTLTHQAHAATLYVSTEALESGDCTARSTPCTLGRAGSTAVAGDTVVIMDGVYHEALFVSNSGTPDAWITFEADECATPIIEGEGSGPDEDSQSSGVHSIDGEYLRFRGLVARGWNIGFGNAWAGGTESDEISNGHWEIEHCISYSNGRTGFTFFSAEGFSLKNSIAAHNGSSAMHSWSSGVSLFEAEGPDNRVEGTISFENTDAQRNTDGSGFIVDEESNGATFVNNIAFGNAGSCFRLTLSSDTTFINNTCFHNSQFGSRATGPTNPGEIYFNNPGISDQNVLFTNNLIVGTGEQPAGPVAVVNPPASGWSDNVVATGNVTFLTDPTGQNPNFVPSAGASELNGAGTAGAETPATDIGFDPQCLVKRTPEMVGSVARESWWQYDIDIDYIKSIGGVASCFNPGPRSNPPDIGAYNSGAVTTVTPGSCVPPEPVAIIDTTLVDADAGAGADAGASDVDPSEPGAGGAGGGSTDPDEMTPADDSVVDDGAGGSATSGGAGGADNAGAGGAGPGGDTDTPTGSDDPIDTPDMVNPDAMGTASPSSPSTSGSAQPMASGSASVGDPAPSVGPASTSTDDGGCDCKVTTGSQRPRSMLGLTVGLFAAGLALTRRRRRSGIVRG